MNSSTLLFTLQTIRAVLSSFQLIWVTCLLNLNAFSVFFIMKPLFGRKGIIMPRALRITRGTVSTNWAENKLRDESYVNCQFIIASNFVWTIHRCKCEFIIVNVSTTFRLIASFYLWTVSYMNIWQRTVYLSNTFLQKRLKSGMSQIPNIIQTWITLDNYNKFQSSLVELTQIYQNKVPNYWNTNYLLLLIIYQ
jgi:hypothetical protein